jgi:hypothetical protein
VRKDSRIGAAARQTAPGPASEVPRTGGEPPVPPHNPPYPIVYHIPDLKVNLNFSIYPFLPPPRPLPTDWYGTHFVLYIRRCTMLYKQ